MEIYDPHPNKREGGIVSRAGPILLVAAVATIAGAAIWWVVYPGASALWRTWVAPIVESVRQAVGT